MGDPSRSLLIYGRFIAALWGFWKCVPQLLSSCCSCAPIRRHELRMWCLLVYHWISSPLHSDICQEMSFYQRQGVLDNSQVSMWLGSGRLVLATTRIDLFLEVYCHLFGRAPFQTPFITQPQIENGPYSTDSSMSQVEFCRCIQVAINWAFL